MELVIVAGIFTILGGAATAVLAAVFQRFADRRADRAKAADLFTQAARGITAMEAELALFRHRRDGWRPNLIALGNVFVQFVAGKITSGSWLGGAAPGLRGMTEWDAAEGGRFTDRFLVARAEAVSALIQLSLMSDGLQKAATEVTGALDALGAARKPRDREAGRRGIRRTAGSRPGLRHGQHG
jgi:hypothetical protein